MIRSSRSPFRSRVPLAFAGLVWQGGATVVALAGRGPRQATPTGHRQWLRASPGLLRYALGAAARRAISMLRTAAKIRSTAGRRYAHRASGSG